MVTARGVAADAFFPLVGGGERTARPTDEPRTETSEGFQQVGTYHAISAHVHAHHREEIEQDRTIAGRRDLNRCLRIPHRAGERKRDLLPVSSRGRDW